MRKILFATLFVLVPNIASAHCPLCTAGAGALAVLVASLGVSSVIVGILIGAFALALGLWIARAVNKQYIPYQIPILATVIFLSTVIPIMPLVRDYGPLYVSLGGAYGTLFHNTYTINLYLLGVVIGAVIMFVSPYVSRAITRARGEQMPYQGVSLTLFLLICVSVIVQVLS